MKRNEVAAEVAGGIAILGMLFDFFWVYAQVVDPYKVCLLAQLHWGIALGAFIIALLAVIANELLAPNTDSTQKQTMKTIKSGRIFF